MHLLKKSVLDFMHAWIACATANCHVLGQSPSPVYLLILEPLRVLKLRADMYQDPENFASISKRQEAGPSHFTTVRHMLPVLLRCLIYVLP